ncbi:MAG: hypothetical protein ACD_76C00149G0010 [uncultured bacterium]|nr:MAG: hypothetical protein ACD_76C00149G0010 [uncultured bacterium]HBD05719.1 recombination protein RecR [Candidatus Uhrbacteria bacterium]
MRNFPEPIANLMASLSRLPGVGPKTALRYVFFLLHQSKAELETLKRNIDALAKEIKNCETCNTYTHGENVCSICSDSKRNPSILCVVSESRDIATIESAGAYNGKFFVLGGVINPIEGMTPDLLHTNKLKFHLESRPEISEVILAFNPDIQGETTMMYLSNFLKPLSRKITRLARGLPLGADIEFADEITLGSAISNRNEM